MSSNIQLEAGTQQDLLSTLKARFSNNLTRHKNVDWEQVEAKLIKQPDKILTLYKMEQTGGEPDVVSLENNSTSIIFVDCSLESPKGRRSLCYDHAAHTSRKEAKPINSAVRLATEMGIQLLTQEQYRLLQTYGDFDTKTSSWLQTPNVIRDLGGAIFADKRFNTVFVYHNGAESYYAARGFRGMITI